MNDASTITELDILADVIAADRDDLAAEVAQSVSRWRFGRRTTGRITKRSNRNNKGTIAAQQRQEPEKHLRVGSLINILQAKARLSLKSAGPSGS